MRSALAIGLVLLLSRIAVADTPDANAGRKLFAEGQELYTKSDYDAAAAKFELAYAKDPDPAYMFNLAQAHRLGKRCARAASDYRTFLSLVSDPPNEAEVKIYIRDMDECSPKKPDPIVKAPPIQPPPDPAPVSHGEAHSRRKLAGLALGIGGAAVIGVAGFFTWDASFLAGRRDDVKSSCEPTSSCVATELVDYDSRGHRARTIAITSWAVGGAALVAGVVFWSSGGHEQRTLTIAPTANGAMIVGQF
jgi:tetratricopeptide (TPR) repeat protein